MTLTSSLNREAACGQHWDALVIGAGPAGAVAARQLAQQKLRTLLVERKTFPRYKVCGCCLNQRAINALQQIGLGQLLESAGAVPINQFRMQYQGRKTAVALPGGLAISREVFDTRLVESAIDAGAEFLQDTTAIVVGSSEKRSSRTVELNYQGHFAGSVSAKIVLAADGLGHPSLQNCSGFDMQVASDSRIGVGAAFAVKNHTSYPPGMIHMAIHRSGYVGLVRVEGENLNLAAAIDRAFIKQCAGPAAAVLQILRESGSPVLPEMTESSFKGTLPVTRKTLRPVGDRLFVLGDAAGYLEPFTGEGMANAITEGMAVAQLVPEGIRHWDSALEQKWLNAHYALTDGRLFWCRWLARLLRSPTAVGWGLRLFHLFPGMARPIVARLNH
ncbi:NAD(P)/FAD-dependent oxidoreductase [Gimesia algae]|uniref:Oxidoreductase n=1 Tax=Gimesia algae TaxID=2527971 RepID=A0A517VAL9_9PLAN|nr:FAD-dependent monooxygenase [Gimesia algae]QDT90053.1 Putative oxidoreductase [Gimesia algae]